MTMSTVQFQNTLARPVEISGIGVHSGRYIEIIIYPALPITVLFHCTDVSDSDNIIPATVIMLFRTSSARVLRMTMVWGLIQSNISWRFSWRG